MESLFVCYNKTKGYQTGTVLTQMYGMNLHDLLQISFCAAPILKKM